MNGLRASLFRPQRGPSLWYAAAAMAFGKEPEPVPVPGGNIAVHPQRAAVWFEPGASRRDKESNRMLLCFAFAGLLHFGAMFFKGHADWSAPLPVSASASVTATTPVEVGMAEDEPARPPGPAPGGGSLVPDPRAGQAQW